MTSVRLFSGFPDNLGRLQEERNARPEEPAGGCVSKAPELVVPSAGTHIFIEKLQIPEGILVSNAPNGSVAFFKPFEGGTLIGTTEEPTAITMEPRTTEQHIEYLARNYGDRAVKVAELATQGLGARLHPDHPYLEAEVVYAVREEYAVSPVDVLSRRTRLSFIDEAGTVAALPRVVELMGQTLEWDEATTASKFQEAAAYYERNGLA